MMPSSSPIWRGSSSGDFRPAPSSRSCPADGAGRSLRQRYLNPTNSLIPHSFFWMRYGSGDSLPLVMQAAMGSAQRRPRYGISHPEYDHQDDAVAVLRQFSDGRRDARCGAAACRACGRDWPGSCARAGITRDPLVPKGFASQPAPFPCRLGGSALKSAAAPSASLICPGDRSSSASNRSKNVSGCQNSVSVREIASRSSADPGSR